MMPDNPIQTKEKDLLHRYPLAHRIAGMIRDFKDIDSLVIGIEGEWGSGKTSFINLILEDLRSTNALLITFNPWNFSDQNELIKDFFDSLIDALKEAGFEWESLSQSIDDRVAKRTKKINKKSLAFFINIDELKIKVQGLNKGKLSHEDIETINLYNKPPEDRFDDL
jgi:predicted KAP-like P-loop ATPase